MNILSREVISHARKILMEGESLKLFSSGKIEKVKTVNHTFSLFLLCFTAPAYKIFFKEG